MSKTVDEILKPLFTSVIIFATIAAFFAQPLYASGDRDAVAWAGVNLGSGVALLYWEIYEPSSGWSRRIAFLLGGVPFIIGMLLAVAVLYEIGQIQQNNDKRCALIQHNMLYPKPWTRKDLPDVFQALGCRPQY